MKVKGGFTFHLLGGAALLGRFGRLFGGEWTKIHYFFTMFCLLRTYKVKFLIRVV